MNKFLRLFCVRDSFGNLAKSDDGQGPAYFRDKVVAKAHRDKLNSKEPKGSSTVWFITHGPDHHKHNR